MLWELAFVQTTVGDQETRQGTESTPKQCQHIEVGGQKILGPFPPEKPTLCYLIDTKLWLSKAYSGSHIRMTQNVSTAQGLYLFKNKKWEFPLWLSSKELD